MFNKRFSVIVGMILVAAFSRLLPHPDNMTPLTAIALFAGVSLEKRFSFLVPLLALLLSDLFLGFHSQLIAVYFCFLLTVLIGHFLKHQLKVLPIVLATLISSVLFFIATNFGVWLVDHLYPKNFSGLWMCYTAAIPFFRNTLLGDFFYVAILFGSFAFAQKRYPELRTSLAQVN